ncbi:amino acid ABC transporter permease [Bifidobacterium bombi]|uniref:Polar amino acid ABC transporter, permease protein n=1 Tax=Bifidobacterium bombi DSM 19703 TaxID=1341695 RepID=A0A086BP93_9BIFI|nr:amino acid ABC transporter permease [Bifidobacterium bombi]KFF30757.1 polar amino acid ABC transporter, permease protein [Bifidobacterium bombi DSM 19703]
MNSTRTEWGSILYLLQHYGSEYVASYAVALRIGVVSFFAALVLATVLTVLRVSPIAPLRSVVSGYVEVFRNIPTLCLLIFIVFALPQVGVTLDYEPCVTVTLILVGSAFACDNLRSGINSIDVGQIEAARSLGLPFRHVMGSIVLPQALRAVVQPMTTLFISLVISSSTGALVPLAHVELTGLVNKINDQEALGIPTFIVAALFYVCTGLVIAGIGRFLEKKVVILR